MAVVMLLPGIVSAHSPHHVITDVAVAASEDGTDGDVYIVVTDQLFRSSDGGAVWKNLIAGLTNRYSLTSVVVSPAYAADGTAYVAAAGDGVFITRNGGDSWQTINTGLGRLDIGTLSVSPDFATDGRLLAASTSGGVWRRTADSANWQMVLTEPVQIRALDELSEKPHVYAGDADGRLWRSTDNGRLWEIVHEFVRVGEITSIEVSGDFIWVGTSADGLYRSADAGLSFSRVENLQSLRQEDCRGNALDEPIADLHITSVLASPTENRVIVTTWFNAVFVSDNNGSTWQNSETGLSCDRQADDMSVAHYRKVAVAAGGDGQAGYWLGAFDGLFRASDPTQAWRQLETLPLGQIKGMAVTGGADDPLVVALATYGGGFYLTDDRGQDWTIGNKGLQTTRLTGISFSPDYFADGVIYAGASRRLLRSKDFGESWQRIELEKPSLGTQVANRLGNLGVKADWLRSGSSRPIYPTVIVQTPKRGSSYVLMGTRFHGVLEYNHEDGDSTALWSGTNKIMNTFVMSPNFDQDDTLFASVRGKGVIRSDDGGESWQEINTGLPFVNRWASSVGATDFRRDVHLAISPGFKSDSTLFGGSPAGDGLYISTDRGNAWQRLSIADTDSPELLLAIAISPEFEQDQTLIVSIKGQGLYRSTDGGENFEQVGPGLNADNASIEWLDFSPDFGDDRTVVAASDETLYLSEDGGESWVPVSRPVRYEDMRTVVRFDGKRERRRGEQYSALTETLLSEPGSSGTVSFVGDGVRWIGSTAPNFGQAEVRIDNELVDLVTSKSEQQQPMQEIFTIEGLGRGPHVLEIRVVGGQADNDGESVAIDAIDILP